MLTIWLVELIDQLFLSGSLDRWGIRPRSVEGLTGIALAPFLHGSLAHVAANTMPFLVLGWLVLLRGVKEFFKVSLLTTAFSGLVVWLIGRSSASELRRSTSVPAA